MYWRLGSAEVGGVVLALFWEGNREREGWDVVPLVDCERERERTGGAKATCL